MSLELLKSIGIFLLGLGLFTLSVTAIITCLKTYSYERYREPFFAFCEEGYIKIKAYKDIHNVRVIARNKTICKFDFIKKFESRVCDATKYCSKNIIVFIIKTDKGEDVVKYFKISPFQ